MALVLTAYFLVLLFVGFVLDWVGTRARWWRWWFPLLPVVLLWLGGLIAELVKPVDYYDDALGRVGTHIFVFLMFSVVAVVVAGGVGLRRLKRAF